MQKLIKFILSLCLGYTLYPLFSYAAYSASARQAFYYYAKQGNVTALRELSSRGYSIDVSDQFGNSALCEAVYRQDYSTFSILKQAGASTSHPCVARIPTQSIQQFNQGYVNWARAVNSRQISYAGATYLKRPVASSIVEDSSGLSAAAVVGATVGVAALVGGGIALAGGGGGGGSSKSSQPQDLCSGVICEDVNAVCRSGSCVCKDGYDYHGTSVCHKTLNCVHGTQVGASCSCTEGWTGSTCETPASCPGYNIVVNTCPKNAVSCSSCKKGDKIVLKVDSCKEGWTGPVCETPVSCPYSTTSCGEGYYETGNTCKSAAITYKECAPVDCAAQGYKTSCEEGYEATQACLSGIVPYYSCNLIVLNCNHGSQVGTECVCDEGWEGTNCDTASSCDSSFNLKSCPSHAICSPCVSGSKTLYKVDSCKEGWDGYNCGSLYYCAFTTLSCGEGYHETGLTCKSGETVYQICAEDGIDCEAGGFNLSECPYWAESCAACTSGDTVKFKAITCWEGWEGPSCETKHVCTDDYVPYGVACTGEYSQKTNNECWSGEDVFYECTCPGFTSDENCISSEQICEKNGTSFYKCNQCKDGWVSSGNSACRVNSCSGYNFTTCPENAAECAQCLSDTTVKWKVVSCKEGWKGTDCTTPASCTGYNFDECPEDALECEVCLSGTNRKYKISVCPAGLTLVDEACVCSDKGSLTTITHCKSETTCQSGEMTYHTCIACDDGYNLWNNTCVICPANYYAQNGACFACPAHSSAPINSTGPEACVCDPDYEKINGLCRPIMSEEEKQKWRQYSKEEFEAHPNYINTNTLAPINAAQAYSKFILYNDEDGTFDYSSLAPVKVIVNDTKGGQQDTAFQNAAKVINFAVDENGDYDSLGEDNVYDNGGHGISVASVIAAKWNNTNDYWGVAPNASVYLMGNGIATNKQLELIQTAVDKGARIFNMSWISGSKLAYSATLEDARETFDATGFTSIRQRFQLLGRNNVVMVQGAGNDGTGYAPYPVAAAGAHEWAEDGRKYSLENLYIVATGIKVNETTGQYSSHVGNRCGYTQAWCIGAPIGTKTLYGNFVGTSNSTPIVSGAVAFLMGAYPYMTSQQIVELIFRSANKNATNWVDDGYWTDSFGHVYRTSSLYGHGALDLGAATEPMGVISIPTSTTTSNSLGNLNAIQKSSVAATKLALPRALNSNLSVSLPTTIMGLDDYNRPFPILTRGFIKQAHRTDQSFLRHFRSFMNRDKRTITGVPDKMSFEFASSLTDDNLLGLGILDINYRFNDKASLLFSYRSDRLEEERHFDKALANPFLDMRNSYALTQSFSPNKRWTFKLNATLGKNGFYEGDEDLDEEYNKSMQAFSSEVDYKLKGDFTVKFMGGLLSEKDSALGVHGTGALETDTSRTYFAGGGVSYQPISKLALSAVYYYGRTDVPKSGGIISFDNIISDAFALDARYHLDNKQMFGVQLSSPLRIKRGSATFNIPVARDMTSDTVYYDTMKVKLKPEAREYDLGFYYEKEAYYYDWRGELMTRFHPDHMADAKPDYRALFGLSLKY